MSKWGFHPPPGGDPIEARAGAPGWGSTSERQIWYDARQIRQELTPSQSDYVKHASPFSALHLC
jgi:hypothetical protein